MKRFNLILTAWRRYLGIWIPKSVYLSTYIRAFSSNITFVTYLFNNSVGTKLMTPQRQKAIWAIDGT